MSVPRYSGPVPEKLFEHVLVTRFNSPISDNSPVPDDDWLRTRLALFKRFALPSVRSQSVAPDRWLLLCHADSPQWFVDELNATAGDIAEAVWLHNSPSGPLLAQLCSPVSHPFLISTRMDNDDCVADDFIAAVQDEFRMQDAMGLNFIRGLQYSGGKLYKKSDASNPFISVIERVTEGPLLTVLVEQHHLIGRRLPVTQVRANPMWIQVVHGGNIANGISGIRTGAEAVASRFAADLPMRYDSPLELRVDQMINWLQLMCRLIAHPSRLRKLARLLR
jgi:hypothetical protein